MPDRGSLVKLDRLVKERKMTSLRCIVGVRPDGIEMAIGEARKDRQSRRVRTCPGTAGDVRPSKRAGPPLEMRGGPARDRRCTAC